MSTRVRSLTLRSSTEVGFCHDSLRILYDFKWSDLVSKTQMETAPHVTETVQN